MRAKLLTFFRWDPLRVALSREVLPLFDLSSDMDEAGAVESIQRSVEFRGAQLWTLIFAILVASIGLNMNSTAVIIGAMLISPLMGPIVGAGLALGVNDFDLLKRSLKNLGVAAGFSVLASALYFFLSPLSEAQSELLARTQPTIYDVLIALFGGATGIVAATRKERGNNAVPGVAIATALMPPLCTAGYGLATGEPRFFLGASYLFFINSTFICLATFLVVRYLRFAKVSFVDRATERRVGFYMMVFALLTVLPSFYTAWHTVRTAVFQARANRFLSDNFQFETAKVVDRKLVARGEKPRIEVTLVGSPLGEETLAAIRARQESYGLEGATLIVHEAGAGAVRDLEARLSRQWRADFLDRLYKDNEMALKTKDEQIRLLEQELLRYRRSEALVAEAVRELAALSPKIEDLSFAHMALAGRSGGEPRLVPRIIVSWKRTGTRSERRQIEQFLRVRLSAPEAEFLHTAYRPPSKRPVVGKGEIPPAPRS